MRRTSIGTRALTPFRNPESALEGDGGQIDWARLPAFGYQTGKFTVKLGEAVSIGETEITVDALTNALKNGAILDFGEVEGAVVELSGNEAIGQTDLSVVALPAPIPAGTLLDFGTGEQVVKTTADAAAGATTLVVEALIVALETGDTATYYGGRKQLILDADAEVGATTITVQPAQFAIADDSTAQADLSGDSGGRTIQAGTVMCRTSAGKLIPRNIGTGAGTEVASELLFTDADENSKNDSMTGYGTIKGNTGLYENLCPDAGTNGASAGLLPTGWKTELATAGCTFYYTAWRDSSSE